MTVRAERVGSAVVLNLEGPLTVDADTRRLRELVGSMTRFSPRHVILDLRKVERLDCSGIGQLVQLHNRIGQSGGVLTLVNVDDQQKRLLQMVGLLNVFRISDSPQEALEDRPTTAARPSLVNAFEQGLYGDGDVGAEQARRRGLLRQAGRRLPGAPAVATLTQYFGEGRPESPPPRAAKNRPWPPASRGRER